MNHENEWKYNSVTKDALRIDDHSVLINFPLSKAFWAENQRDMIVATPDDQPHFALLILNDDLDELEEIQVVENPSAYVFRKAQEVIDLTRS